MPVAHREITKKHIKRIAEKAGNGEESPVGRDFIVIVPGYKTETNNYYYETDWYDYGDISFYVPESGDIRFKLKFYPNIVTDENRFLCPLCHYSPGFVFFENDYCMIPIRYKGKIVTGCFSRHFDDSYYSDYELFPGGPTYNIGVPADVVFDLLGLEYADDAFSYLNILPHSRPDDIAPRVPTFGAWKFKAGVESKTVELEFEGTEASDGEITWKLVTESEENKNETEQQNL